LILRAAISAACLVAAQASGGESIRADGAAELGAAIAAAAPGERILLAPGAYGALIVRGRTFAPAIEIAAADPSRPPHFASIRIADSTGVHFADIGVAHGPAAKPEQERAVDITRSRDIEFLNAVISGAPDGDPANDPVGLVIRDSARIRIEGSRFHDLWRGAAVLDSTGWSIRGSQFRRMGSDGIVGRGAVRARIEDNLFTDFSTDLATGVHPDAIQFWDRGAARAIDGLTVSGNTVLRGRGGPSQGVFINGENPALVSRNILIENNVIHQSMLQGILVKNVDGAIIRHNTVAPFDPATDAPGIEARAPAVDVVVEGNLAASLRPAGLGAGAGNILIDYDNPWIASYAEKALANPRAGVEARPADFRALGGAGALLAESWGNVAPENRIARVFPKTIFDLTLRNGEPVDESSEPASLERRSDGALTFAASPKWTGMPTTEIRLRVRRAAPPPGWEYLLVAPGAYDIRLNRTTLLATFRNEFGVSTKISVPFDIGGADRDIVVRYDGVQRLLEVRDGTRLLRRVETPPGLIAYRKTAKLHVGGAPWGQPFSGTIERLVIER
jgi:hypothetical protein